MTLSARTDDVSGCAALFNLVSNIPAALVLMYVGRIRNGFTSTSRRDSILEFRGSVDLQMRVSEST